MLKTLPTTFVGFPFLFPHPYSSQLQVAGSDHCGRQQGTVMKVLVSGIWSLNFISQFCYGT